MSGNVSKRVFMTVPDAVYEELEQWAESQGRSVSNLTAFLVESALKEAKQDGSFKPKKGGDRHDTEQ